MDAAIGKRGGQGYFARFHPRIWVGGLQLGEISAPTPEALARKVYETYVASGSDSLQIRYNTGINHLSEGERQRFSLNPSLQRF